MGHLGTLDPPATGVLPIAMGKATRLIPYLEKGVRGYMANIQLGIVTDTDDTSGEILESKEVSRFPIEIVRNIIGEFIGSIRQTPPTISAIHIEGQRAYKLAREGKRVKISPRTVQVYSIDILNYNHPEIILNLKVGRGVYVRSIARDLGCKLGCGAAVSKLVRTLDEPFELRNAHSIREVEEAATAGKLDEILISPEEILKKMTTLIVNPEGVREISHGRPICKRQIVGEYPVGDEPENSKKFFLFDASGNLLAVANNSGDGILRMEKVFIIQK